MIFMSTEKNLLSRCMKVINWAKGETKKEMKIYFLLQTSRPYITIDPSKKWLKSGSFLPSDYLEKNR